MMTEVAAGLLLTSGATTIFVRDIGVLALALAWALDSRRPEAALDDGRAATPRMSGSAVTTAN
jgi:hypothetical protein